MQSTEQLMAQLQQERNLRQQTESALHQAHDQLQQHLEEHTTTLFQTNLQLRQAIRQHQQTEATLHKSQQELERLSNVLSYAMEGISRLDLQGHYVQINQAYANPLGYSPEEMIGMDWRLTVHPDDLEAVQLAYQHMLQQGKVEVEARGVRRDGSIFYKQLVMVTTYDSQQQLIGHYCFMKDISDRKAHEVALQASEQRYASLTQAVPVGIFRTDPQGHCLYVNERWCQITGLTWAEAQQDGWAQALHPDDRERISSKWYECAQHGLPFQSEYRFQAKNGDIRWVVGQAIAERGINAELLGYVGSITDISDRKRQEEVLQNIALGVSAKTGAAFFHALVDYLTKALGVEFAFIGELTRPEQASIRTIAGYGDGQAIEPYEYELADTPAEQVTISGRQLCLYASQIQQHFPQDPYLRNIEAEAYMGLPLLDARGKVLGLISVLSRQPLQDTDLMAQILTIFAARAAAELERQQGEVKLQRQKQELARSNTELQQFAYVASHDLQEPLRMVTSYLDLIKRRYKDQLDSQADQFIDYAVDGAVRMQALINALLTYSRIGAREQLLEPVDCATVLQDVLTNLQVTIAQDNITVTADQLPQVRGDRTQLIQLFQNIISNAIKFRRENTPQIHVGVTRLADQWLFSIQDNGIGIEAQHLDRIFIIFQRLHSRSEYPGTGIGLAICKKIIERHGGKLWVESQPNQGSVFYFTLAATPNL